MGCRFVFSRGSLIDDSAGYSTVSGAERAIANRFSLFACLPDAPEVAAGLRTLGTPSGRKVWEALDRTVGKPRRNRHRAVAIDVKQNQLLLCDRHANRSRFTRDG